LCHFYPELADPGILERTSELKAELKLKGQYGEAFESDLAEILSALEPARKLSPIAN
jgi:hypothetical protein